jgi:ribosomal protein L4
LGVKVDFLGDLSINKITVYEFLIRDPNSGEFVLAPCKATREAIQILRGEVMENTADRVAESQLDENGFVSSLQLQRVSGTTPQSHP